MLDMFKSVSEMSSQLTRSSQSNKLYVPGKIYALVEVH